MAEDLTMNQVKATGGRKLALVWVTASLIGAAGCEEGPLSPRTSEEISLAAQPEVPEDLQTQIDALFSGGPRRAATVQVRNILRQAGRDPVSVPDMLIGFIDFASAQLDAGNLTDPGGPNAAPTPEGALASLISAVAESAGLTFPQLSETVFTDGGFGTLGPSGGTLVANTGFAGIQMPPGALGQEVLVVIQRLPQVGAPGDGDGPLPTDLDQYPLFYDISLFPETELLSDAIVGVCVVDPPDPFAPDPEVAGRLRLAHPDPDNPTVIEILPLADAAFLDCGGAMTSSSRVLADRRLTLASPGALGGRISAFSPFAAVDPLSGDGDGFELAGGTWNGRGDGVIGTAFLFDPLTSIGPITSMTITGPAGWNDGSPFTNFVYRPAGIAPDKSVGWMFFPAVSGNYVGTTLIAGETLTSTLFVDSSEILAPPEVTGVTAATSAVSVSWTGDASHESYLLRIDGIPFEELGVQAQIVLDGTARSHTFTGLSLVPGVQYFAFLSAFNDDLTEEGPIPEQFNIGAHGQLFVVP
jgi:hypothetical protein